MYLAILCCYYSLFNRKLVKDLVLASAIFSRKWIMKNLKQANKSVFKVVSNRHCLRYRQ